jgi:hypothetical protein
MFLKFCSLESIDVLDFEIGSKKLKSNLFPKGELGTPKAAVFASFIYFIFLPVGSFQDYLECADSSIVIGIEDVVRDNV